MSQPVMRLQAATLVAVLGALFLRPPLDGQVTLDQPELRAHTGSSRLRVPRRTWIVNGSVEQTEGAMLGADAGAAYHQLYGWRTVDGSWYSQKSGWFGVKAAKGSHFLRPGEVDHASLVQRREDDFDGISHLMLTGRFRNLEGKDTGRVKVRLLDFEGKILREACSEDLQSPRWTAFCLFIDVPDGARMVETEIEGQRSVDGFCDTYFDDLRLTPFSATELAGKPALSFPRIAEEYLGRDPEDQRGRILALLAMFAHYRQPALDFVHDRQADPTTADRAALVTGLALSGWEQAAAEVVEIAEWSLDSAEQLAALRALPALTPDWVGRCANYARSDDPVRSRTAFHLLAGARSPAALAIAAEWHARGAEPTQVAQAVEELGRHFTIDELYPNLLEHLLAPDADMEPRQVALELLAENADARLVPAILALRDHASIAERATWMKLLAPLDNGRALDAMVQIMPRVDDPEAWQTDRCFLQAAATMRSEDSRRWFLRQGLSSPRAKVRVASLQALDHALQIHEIALLMGMSRDPDPEVSAALAQVFGKQRGREALNGLYTLIANRTPGVGAEAVRAYWDHLDGNSAAVTMCRKLIAQPRTWEMAVAATELLASVSARQFHDLFVTNLSHPSRQLRASSYRALAKDRRPLTVAQLVKAMATEPGPAMPVLLDALHSLTGERWGPHPLAWQKWWDGVAVGYRCPTGPFGNRMKAMDRSAVSFRGLSLPSGNLTIILDLSPALAGPLQDGVLLDEVRHSLRDLLGRLSGKHHFRILACRDRVVAFRDQALVANPDSVGGALDWIDSLGVQDLEHGWTPLPLALQQALVDPDVNDILVITDGGAAVGRTDSYRGLAEEVRERNLEVGARIHVVQVGDSRSAWRVLKGLAEGNGGRLARL